MSSPTYVAYGVTTPYFDLVREASRDLVDGRHFL